MLRKAARAGIAWAPAADIAAGLAAGLTIGIAVGMACGSASAQTAPVAAPGAALSLIAVTHFDVQGNTLLPLRLIEQTLEPYTGNVSVQRLREAASAVQTLYRRAGYGGVVAFLPEQALAGGAVQIRVVEGKLTRVDVADNRQYSTENIRASLPTLRTGATPNVRRIDAEIQMANENPAKNVQVLLQPGAEAGAIVAKVSVQEQPVQRFSGRLENTGGQSIGRWRAALGWQHANVWGLDHIFAAELQTAPQDVSGVAVASGSYRAPLYGQAMALDVYGAWSEVDAGKVGTAAGDLQISGRGGVAGLRGSFYLPRSGNVDQRLLLGVEWRTYLNSCSIQGLPQGACGTAGASVSVQPLGLTYTAQAAGAVRWGLSLGLFSNLALGGKYGAASDFEAVRSGSEPRYTLARATGQITLPVGEGGAIAARAAGQATGQPLVPGELFGIGGAQSVRGFEERELSGDSGASLNLEAVGPNWAEGWGASWAALQGTDLRGLAFADAGAVLNQNDSSCQAGRSRCRMGSLGLGLRAARQDLQVHLDVARAMSTASTTAKGDVRAHFSLLYNF